MKTNRSYSEMTDQEKRHSIELWNKFYNSQLRDDFNSSWRYYIERLNYLQQIGVKVEEVEKKKLSDNIESGDLIR